VKQTHLVAIPTEDGDVALHPMKAWLRAHPAEIPRGLDNPGTTSHQFRAGLKKLGWTIQFLETEVRVVRPQDAHLPAITAVLSETDDDGDELDGEGDGPDLTQAFGLERELQVFLEHNIESIDFNGEHFKLYVDPSGRKGIEYPADGDRIDLLATDSKGAFVVFELKRARAPYHAIGQLTRYMGWVKRTIGRDTSVRGVIVAKAIDNRLRNCAVVIPDIMLWEYSIAFSLTPAHELPES
jgi:hypothetical protein